VPFLKPSRLFFVALATLLLSCSQSVEAFDIESGVFFILDLACLFFRNCNIFSSAVTFIPLGSVWFQDKGGWDMAIHEFWDMDIHVVCLVGWMRRVIFLFGWMDEIT
jgi:hypothetical protein